MTGRQLKRLTLFAAAAGTVAYSLVAGKGVFNKPRFREQHEALSKYVDSNYPDCTYSSITVHGNGWASVIKRWGKPVVFVYFTKGDDGMYIFTETTERK